MIFFKLVYTMLRIRVSLLLGLFLILGSYYSLNVNGHYSKIMIGFIAVVIGYGSATSFNDLADIEADKINLKGAKDRLLANNKIEKEKLIQVGIFCGLTSIILSSFLGMIPFLAMLLIFLINLFYSFPPLKISYRTNLVPFYLSLGYVVLPFITGYFSFSNHLSAKGVLFILGLYFLFTARISLKDFRDREGDKAVGKQTIILKYGKNAVLKLSVSCFIIGLVLTIYGSSIKIMMIAGVIISALLSAFFLIKLSNSKKLKDELLSIGMAARFGNSIIYLFLGYFIFLNSDNWSKSDLAIFEILIISIYLSQFVVFLKSPEYYSYGGGGWQFKKD